MDYEGDSEFVTLGECDSEQELLVVRALLESEGIECFCPRLAWTSQRFKGSYQGFILQVHEADLARARAILDAPVEPLPEDEEA